MSSIFLAIGVQFQVNLLLEGFTSQSIAWSRQQGIESI